jgi:hypothetical protein
MRATRLMMLLIGTAAAVTACRNNQSDQNIAIGDNMPANADIDVLPPDESSETPPNELANGADNADVADLNNSGNAY